jgi:hypothetical protein
MATITTPDITRTTRLSSADSQSPSLSRSPAFESKEQGPTTESLLRTGGLPRARRGDPRFRTSFLRSDSISASPIDVRKSKICLQWSGEWAEDFLKVVANRRSSSRDPPLFRPERGSRPRELGWTEMGNRKRKRVRGRVRVRVRLGNEKEREVRGRSQGAEFIFIGQRKSASRGRKGAPIPQWFPNLLVVVPFSFSIFDRRSLAEVCAEAKTHPRITATDAFTHCQ